MFTPLLHGNYSYVVRHSRSFTPTVIDMDHDEAV
jgi:hypothetical protein